MTIPFGCKRLFAEVRRTMETVFTLRDEGEQLKRIGGGPLDAINTTDPAAALPSSPTIASPALSVNVRTSEYGGEGDNHSRATTPNSTARSPILTERGFDTSRTPLDTGRSGFSGFTEKSSLTQAEPVVLFAGEWSAEEEPVTSTLDTFANNAVRIKSLRKNHRSMSIFGGSGSSVMG